MTSTAAWKGKESESGGAASRDKDEEQLSAAGNVRSLRELTFKLLRQVQSIGEVRASNITSGVDFYDEVTRFEIDLIKRALIRTGWHQRRAAALLNLKVTTLNSKIKQYDIRPLAESDDMETRRRA